MYPNRDFWCANLPVGNSGTDVMIFTNVFAEKLIEKMALLTRNKAKLCKILITTSVVEKNANFSPKSIKNRGKL
jgi:hypothetical protein